MDELTPTPQANPRKGIFFGILLLAVFSAVFGVFRLRKLIVSDAAHVLFAGGGESTNTAQQTLQLPGLSDALALQGKDTDNDGLSDADELNRYKTSPYLADTDSDGFSDKQELDSRNDPNCPSGKTCGAAPITPRGTGTALSPSSDNAASAIPPFSPELLRETLRKQGASEADIARLDDTALRKLYDETLREVEEGGGQLSTAPPSISPEALARATPAELRAILKAQGVAESLLQSVDDAMLLTLVREALRDTQRPSPSP